MFLGMTQALDLESCAVRFCWQKQIKDESVRPRAAFDEVSTQATSVLV